MNLPLGHRVYREKHKRISVAPCGKKVSITLLSDLDFRPVIGHLQLEDARLESPLFERVLHRLADGGILF